jgi:hypothetical protein
MNTILCKGQPLLPSGTVRYVNVWNGPNYGMMTPEPYKKLTKVPMPSYRIKVTFK